MVIIKLVLCTFGIIIIATIIGVSICAYKRRNTKVHTREEDTGIERTDSFDDAIDWSNNWN